jgi:nicotinamide-nucleotide amidase
MHQKSTLSGGLRGSVEILVVGDELLLGEIHDLNTGWLAKSLFALNLRVRGSRTIGDDPDEIAAALREAFSRAEIVLVTGGLGPTGDDLTAEVAAKVLGTDLELRPEVLEWIAARLERPVSALNDAQRKQALVPRGAMLLPNERGTAPGIFLQVPKGKAGNDDGDRMLFLFPGIPTEMRWLFEHQARSILHRMAAKASLPAIAVEYFHAYGLSEGEIAERLRDLMVPGRNPDVGTRVRAGVVTVRVTAKADNDREAARLLNADAEIVRGALGQYWFAGGDQTLAHAAVLALLERSCTVALAESCTAGGVAAALGEIPGVSTVLLGGMVAYSNDVKRNLLGVNEETLRIFGAVSQQTAAEMADGVRRRTDADIAVGVTGIAGPGGGTAQKPVGTVCYAVAFRSRPAETLTRLFKGHARTAVQERAIMQALDLIRRAALRSGTM